MAIWVKCATCGKRYQAADHMAGRRVRCKHCGTTFQLPLEATTPEPYAPSHEPDADHALTGTASGSILDEAVAKYPELAPLPPPQGHYTPPAHYASAPPVNDVDRPTPEITPPFGDEPMTGFPGGGEEPDAESVFEGAFAHEFRAARGNTPFVFPGSRALDRWLPTGLAGLCVTWLAYMCLGSGVGEPPWVGAVRLLLILLTYTGVVFPVCLAGVRKASRRMSYELPSGTTWRAFSSFLFPVTLGCVLWLGTGRIAGFVFGAVAGLVVGLPAMWFLFRVRTDDAPVSLKYAAMSYGGSVLASMVLLGLLNLLLVGVIRGAKAEHSLAMSPFGPGFKWDGPTVKTPPPTPPAKLAVLPERGEPIAPTTKAFAGTPGDAQGAEPAPGPSVTVVSPAPGSSAPGSSAAAAPVVPGPGAVPTPASPTEVRAAEARQATPEAQPNTELAAGDKRVEGPQYGSVVAEVIQRLSGEMQALVYPTLPGRAVAVVRAGKRANEDRVELWGADDWKLRKAVTFARPADAAGAAGTYHLNAEGTLLARLANFPYFSAQTYSFANDVLLRPFIKLDAAGPARRIAGFVGPGRLLMLVGSGAQSSAEIWDVNRAAQVLRFPIAGCRATPGSHAISSDGRQLAVIVRDDAAGANVAGRLEVYNLASGKPTRRIVIDQLQWNAAVKPSGLAFTDEADQIGVLFEHEGQGLFACWGVNDDVPLATHVYPGGLLPEGVNTASFRGPPFAMVDEGRAWLLYGSSVFDTASGKLLGDLGIKDVRSQSAVRADTIFLVQQPEGTAATALLEVRLDVNRARREALSKR